MDSHIALINSMNDRLAQTSINPHHTSAPQPTAILPHTLAIAVDNMLPKLPAGLSARMPCHDEFYMTINNETYFFRRNLIAGPIWSVAMVFLIWVNLSVLYNNYRNQQQASLKITTYPKWMFWVVLQFSFLYFFMIWVGEFFVGSWNGKWYFPAIQ